MIWGSGPPSIILMSRWQQKPKEGKPTRSNRRQECEWGLTRPWSECTIAKTKAKPYFWEGGGVSSLPSFIPATERTRQARLTRGFVPVRPREQEEPGAWQYSILSGEVVETAARGMEVVEVQTVVSASAAAAVLVAGMVGMVAARPSSRRVHV